MIDIQRVYNTDTTEGNLIIRSKVPNVFSSDIDLVSTVTHAVNHEWVNYKLTDLTETQEVREINESYSVVDDYEVLKRNRRSVVSSIVLYQNLIDLDDLPSKGKSLSEIMVVTYEIIETNGLCTSVSMRLRDSILELSELLDRTPHQVLSHGNLSWSNILVRGSSFMPINFEYCSVRDHSWDYASLLSMIEDEFSRVDYTYSLYNPLLEYIVEYFSDDLTEYYDPLIRPKITSSLYMYDLWSIALLHEIGGSQEVIDKKLVRVTNFEIHSSYMIEYLVRRLRRYVESD